MASGGGGAENGEGRKGESVLVTGGAGYIGTHTVLRLLEKGYVVTVVDNFHNSVPEALDRVRLIAGPALSSRLDFIPGDLKSKDDMEKVFAAKSYDAVIHFAGLKAVGESVAHPTCTTRTTWPAP
ncbi:hypothetical protein GUJ93_ZPchr0002g26252 [Zizania palustris]|uniref:UDP-glucose 4-epimerase n=1 Tax=Zizania palustris TaxID=103762 RepID=A0A8J5SLS9_ZIZPA|nr:hypothetical protein GUJ93_ZPchr0002g26252 [Zizania palustris]